MKNKKYFDYFNIIYIASASALAWYFYQDIKKKAGKTQNVSTTFGVRG
jgi:hypothetical protein